MQPGIIYRLSWNTVESQTSTSATTSVTIPAMAMVVDILDTETLIDDADTPVVFDLTPTGSPLIIRIINNDRDKFSPIRAKQATIQFISDKSQFQDVTTFTDSSDNRWSVQITADGNPVFYGFLMLPDSSMPFQPDPNVVQLTASDHLGSLKDLPLTKDDGTNPIGKFKIGELIAMCLKKTGLELDIVVINNLRAGSGSVSPTETIFTAPVGTNEIRVSSTYGAFFYPGQIINVTGTVNNNTTYHVVTVTDDGSTVFVTVSDTVSTPESSFSTTLTDDASSGHFYDKVWLDIKTFEQEIGVSEFCYTVLEKILGEDCFLSQWQGKWYIARVDEYDNHSIYPATFNSDGIFQSFDAHTSYSKSIGAAEVRRFANADQLLEFDRPNNFIKNTYRYLTPAEIPDNADYSRGDVTTRVTETGYTAYNLDQWGIGNLWGSAETLPDIDAVILRSFNTLGDETSRFIMLTQPSGLTGAFNYIRSSAIPVGFNDKINVSFDVSAMTNPSGDGILQVCFIVLYAFDGTVYIQNPTNTSTTWLNDDTQPPLTWHTTDAQLSLFRTGLNLAFHDSGSNVTVKTDWQSCSIECTSVPKDGELRLYFFAGNQNPGSFDDIKLRYQNLKVEYRPYIGGSYQKYTGNYDKVQRSDTGFLSKREKEVSVQDSQKPLFKGAFFIISNTRLLHSGSITFAAPNTMSVSGYKVNSYSKGQRIIITGTNAGVYTVSSVTYHIIGNTTEIDVEEQTITTVTESATISEYIWRLTTQWYSAAPNYTADPPASIGFPASLSDLHSYSYIQSYSVWNQYKNANRIISGGVLGLGSMWCDAFDKISLTDNNPNTNNRYFMLLSFEQNWKTALWSGVFIEDYRTDLGRDTTSSHEFKYTVT